MGKETNNYLEELDAIPVGQRIDIDGAKKQSYRNNALFLKKLKQKHIMIKKVNGSYIAIRLL